MSVKVFRVYDPQTRRWLAATGEEWTADIAMARRWSDFYEARNHSMTLPNKHALYVTESEESTR